MIWPANETESTIDCVMNDQRETREMPSGVRLRCIWRDRRMRRVRYTPVDSPASTSISAS